MWQFIKFKKKNPHVVLLDVLMPKTDGIEILRQIKTIHPGCEVIILTGVNSQQLAAKAMDFGAFGFVRKPFDVVELRQKVKKALEKSRPENAITATNFPERKRPAVLCDDAPPGHES